jgi:hypothetical protein
MGRMSELAQELAELKRCGEILIGISEILTEMFSVADEPVQEAPVEKLKPEKKKASARKKDETPVTEPVKEYTFTEVRTILADKSKAGHTAEVKEILAKHGAEKLSEIKPEEYAAVIAEAEVLE